MTPLTRKPPRRQSQAPRYFTPERQTVKIHLRRDFTVDKRLS